MRVDFGTWHLRQIFRLEINDAVASRNWYPGDTTKLQTPLDLECTLTGSFLCVVTKEGVDEDWRAGEAFGTVCPRDPLL